MRTTDAITIRRAHPEEPGVLRVAVLDSSRVPVAPLLIAEVDGQVRAVLSLEDGSTIGDPFFATADLIALLRAHAAATRRPAPSLLSRLRLRPRSAF